MTRQLLCLRQTSQLQQLVPQLGEQQQQRRQHLQWQLRQQQQRRLPEALRLPTHGLLQVAPLLLLLRAVPARRRCLLVLAVLLPVASSSCP